MKVLAGALLAACAAGNAVEMNPMRRVISMLQAMQEKIEKEGKDQAKLMAKFECYCKNNSGELKKSIVDGGAKIQQLGSSITASENDRKVTLSELAQAKADRAEAQKNIEDSTDIRSKEAKEYAESSAEFKSNIEAMGNAIASISKGMSGALLQTRTGGLVERLVSNSVELTNAEKDQVSAFLQGGTGYAPASGQIVGILKQMKETMEKDLADLEAQEKDAVDSFNSMTSAKNKEIAAATTAIEEKTQKQGDLAVSIVQMKDDKEDTEKSLAADEGYLAQLGQDCEDKVKEYQEIKQTRSEELLAISDTIKILNDDDALDLFKKTLPSLLQVAVSDKQVRSKALAVLKRIDAAAGNPHLDLISLTLANKKNGFEKVIKMVDEMKDALKKEQEDDDSKREYCKAELDKGEDKVKTLKHTLSNLAQTMSNSNDAISNLNAEIKSLEDGIASLDKATADATEQRKEEHDAFIESSTEDRAALQIMEFAKNRLNKFYNPNEYKAPPKRELTEEERMYSAYGGDIGTTPAPGGIANTGAMALVAVGAHHKEIDAPAPPPSTGSFGKKKGESSGVIGMMDMMINDLKKQMQEATFDEESSQQDYEKLMADAAKKRAADSASISEKEGALAETQEELHEAKDTSSAKMNQLEETQEYLVDMHKTCDFLLENYQKRKDARATEIDGLNKAKEILSGADFSLAQTSAFMQKK
mmetsp:Transcript_24982/g.54905  ORF Transcript_24982/g.54905 Transcript_24982/m.54905 type:complete len:703 (+) Transcript_24982:62-2170(+)|eukprot:CAMPEP_0204270530 /NCGR_PEP_ID=MMETSP0468-20130131/18948_1 /ASSEMBLY_ACC=CAM_ASM_000383 /TAXON_ID=2969 /ORGANISM="Oxyrrhis marina" /LENGTH=702 /DNA_ID=CAMNT_0051246079 /DNA_START=57 /DNA_END=2165 /DNA_ORIENTATION=-